MSKKWSFRLIDGTTFNYRSGHDFIGTYESHILKIHAGQYTVNRKRPNQILKVGVPADRIFNSKNITLNSLVYRTIGNV